MPAYNEAGCIEEVVREWVTTVGRLVVVNDGSRDATGEILDRLAKELPLLHVIHQGNAGHGVALMTGYRAALDLGVPWIFARPISSCSGNGATKAIFLPGAVSNETTIPHASG